MLRVLRLPLAVACAVAAFAAAALMEEPAGDAGVLAADDECQSGDTSCSLNMLQVKESESHLAREEPEEEEDEEDEEGAAAAAPEESHEDVSKFELWAEGPELLQKPTNSYEPMKMKCGEYMITEGLHGCCAGRPYTFGGTYDCCGGTKMFNQEDIGCCYHPGQTANTTLNQLFWIQKMECCDTPRGTCVLKHKQRHCCARGGIAGRRRRHITGWEGVSKGKTGGLR